MLKEHIITVLIDVTWQGKKWVGQFSGKKEHFPSLILREVGKKGERIFSYGHYSWEAAERIVQDKVLLLD